jgi:hypothetical protein
MVSFLFVVFHTETQEREREFPQERDEQTAKRHDATRTKLSPEPLSKVFVRFNHCSVGKLVMLRVGSFVFPIINCAIYKKSTKEENTNVFYHRLDQRYEK